MKKITTKIVCFSLTGAAFLAEARKVGVDFAPVTVWDSAANKEVPLSDHGQAVGWYLKGIAGIDYTKIQTSETYAQQVLTANSDAFNTNVENLVYDLNTGNSLTKVPLAKDSSGKEVTYATCFDAASFGSNHRSCEIYADNETGFTLVQVNTKWSVGNTQAIKFEGKTAVAWGEIDNTAGSLFGAYLAKKYGSDPKYLAATDNGADPENLAYNFTTSAILPFVVNGVTQANIALVKGSADANVPKGDENSFGATVKGTLKLVRNGEKITLEKVNPAAVAVPVQK